MANIILGLKSAYIAELTKDIGGECVYSVPERAYDIQEVTFTPNVQTTPVPGDDGIVTTLMDYSTAGVTATFAHQSAQSRGFLLGETRDDDGVLVSGGNSEAPYVALGYTKTMHSTVTKGEKTRYVWLTKVKFSPAAETSQTKQPNGINPQYPQVTGEAIKRVADATLKINIDSDDPLFTAETGQNWFTQGTLQKLRDGAVTVLTQPVSVQVSDTGTFPVTGQAGALYVDNSGAEPVFKFWTGTAYATINATDLE